MKDRLKQLRKHLELTQSEFGKKIGLSDVAISYMESGRTAINDQNMNLICLTFGVNKDWFRFGKGEMIDEDALFNEKQKQLLAFFECLSPRAMDMAIEYVEKLVADEVSLYGEILGRSKDFSIRETRREIGLEGEKVSFTREIKSGVIGAWKKNDEHFSIRKASDLEPLPSESQK